MKCRFCGQDLPAGWKAEWTHAACNREYERRLVRCKCVFCGRQAAWYDNFICCPDCLAVNEPPYRGYPGGGA